jgi:hypothetical protein
MDRVIKMLVKLFYDKGMTEDEISNCITFILDFFYDANVKCSKDLNHKMREAGWQDFDLDDEVFKMASTGFEI